MKDYTISVPLSGAHNSPVVREQSLIQYKRAGVKRVFVGCPNVTGEPDVEEKEFEQFKEAVDLFHKNGIEVGLWCPSSFGRGFEVFDPQINDEGKSKGQFKCHAGEALIRFHEEKAKKAAAIGADIYMLDDDFHQQHGSSNSIKGCFCEHHKKLFDEVCDGKLDFSLVKEKFWDDCPNPYRETYFRALGLSLERFVARIRKAIDTVNPNMRLALCAHGADYYWNGTDIITLAKIAAGNTKPLVRTIGAPYWDYFSAYPDRLASVFELERAEFEFLKNSGIETMAEGDSFPRPRYTCSAAQLELFDMAMRADGKANGILKYMLCYRATPEYELGYVNEHVYNKPIYEQIDKYFTDKTSVGARVYQFIDKCMVGEHKYNKFGYSASIIPTEGYVLSQLSIPTTYEGKGIAGVAFGENAKYLTDEQLAGGILTDVMGAMALTERGIDCGLVKVVDKLAITGERFSEYDSARCFPNDKSPYKIEVSKDAKVISGYSAGKFSYYKELDKITNDPATYLYENAKGQRFCVMAFDAKESISSAKSLLEHYRSYGKSKLLMDALEWLGGKKLPARCENNPDLYLMCKKDDDGAMAVGLWNLSRDKIRQPFITLDKEYSQIEFINCTGKLEGDKVTLSTIHAYDFAGFNVK
jgi:hypothetical protein